LHAGMDSKSWSQVFAQAYEDFCRRVDAFDATCEAAEARAEENGGEVEYPDDLRIDPYASEHPSEFFAVMSEVFFVAPEIVKAEYPAVYAQLAMFYRQDPAARQASQARQS
jgi:Mlc titration factor MtfA (ptsG expression regulator)